MLLLFELFFCVYLFVFFSFMCCEMFFVWGYVLKMEGLMSEMVMKLN